MTVQDTTPQVTFVGTGAQLSFAFTFRVNDIAWLSVDYVVNFDVFTINPDQDNNPGGTVEYTVAPPLAQELTVLRATPNVQLLDYTRYDPFDSESHEDALDRLTMQIQDLDNYIQQTLTQDFDLLGNVDFATKVPGSMIYWDDGTQFWMDTAAQVRYLGGTFIVDAASSFRGNVSFEANATSISGNSFRFLNASNLRWADLAVTSLTDFDITTPNLVNARFIGFTGRVMQDAETLAYVSELPVLISDHTLLSNIGVNTHVQIDTHIADGTIHFSEASIDHTAIANIGINSHGIIDSHIADASIHFTQAGINHLTILNIGVNTHAQIDAAIITFNAHIADATIHFADAPADGNDYARNNNGWNQVFSGVTDHLALTNIGVNTHATIDTHLAFAQIHFPDAPADFTTYARNNNAWVPVIDGVTDHTLLTNIGVTTHAGIDLHIADVDIHFGDAPADANDYVRNNNAWVLGGGGVSDHLLLINIGVNTHAQIDTHVADSTIHFLEASIDHTAISNIGVNSHAAIDTHIADGTIHFTVASIDHGSIAGLADDDHLQYLFLAGRAGGQVANGGTLAGQTLTLRGSTNADRGRVINEGGISIDWDWTSDAITNGGITSSNTVPASGASITSFITLSNNITVDNGFFIMSAMDDNKILEWVVAPGFAVTTLFFARSIYRSTTAGIAPAQSFVLAAQNQYNAAGCGVVTVPNYRGLSYSPILKTDIAGDNLTVTNLNAVTVGPLWNTKAGTTANFGTIRGVHMTNPAAVLFGTSAGVETCLGYIGLDMNNITLATTGVRAAVRSALTASAVNRFLLNSGGAVSDFGNGDIHLNDQTWLAMGGAIGSDDIIMGWQASQSALVFSTFFGVGGNPLYLRPTAQDEWVFQHDNGGTVDIGIGFNVNAVTFGVTLPTPNSNNWFVQFAGPNMREVFLNGEYSDVLWTASGSINVAGHTVSDLQAFKINSPSIILNGGTIDDMSNLYVAAMPSFGATRVQALRVLGRARIDGHQNYGARSPAQITASQNDYQLGPNNAGRTMNLLNSDAAWNITGIDSSFGFAQDGDAICLYNTGAFGLTLTHQDVASTAANRFISATGVNYLIGPNECIWIYYDLVVARWRLLEGTGA